MAYKAIAGVEIASQLDLQNAIAGLNIGQLQTTKADVEQLKAANIATAATIKSLADRVAKLEATAANSPINTSEVLEEYNGD